MSFIYIEWFEVAILAWYFCTRSAATTEKHWHLYRKSASHKGGMEEAQLEEMFEAMLVLPITLLSILYKLQKL